MESMMYSYIHEEVDALRRSLYTLHLFFLFLCIHSLFSYFSVHAKCLPYEAYKDGVMTKKSQRVLSNQASCIYAVPLKHETIDAFIQTNLITSPIVFMDTVRNKHHSLYSNHHLHNPYWTHTLAMHLFWPIPNSVIMYGSKSPIINNGWSCYRSAILPPPPLPLSISSLHRDNNCCHPISSSSDLSSPPPSLSFSSFFSSSSITSAIPSPSFSLPTQSSNLSLTHYESQLSKKPSIELPKLKITVRPSSHTLIIFQWALQNYTAKGETRCSSHSDNEIRRVLHVFTGWLATYLEEWVEERKEKEKEREWEGREQWVDYQRGEEEDRKGRRMEREKHLGATPFQRLHQWGRFECITMEEEKREGGEAI